MNKMKNIIKKINTHYRIAFFELFSLSNRLKNDII